ncbi:hypothetical protein BC628DRAFT_811303 [Trametes gibbosa]|nr:hypothetical protein BC628DRAFT_811303 [Trametes gibbosa]
MSVLSVWVMSVCDVLSNGIGRASMGSCDLDMDDSGPRIISAETLVEIPVPRPHVCARRSERSEVEQMSNKEGATHCFGKEVAARFRN